MTRLTNIIAGLGIAAVAAAIGWMLLRYPIIQG